MEDKLEKVISRLDRLTKELSRDRLQNKHEIEKEAKEILKIYLEKARAEVNPSYDEPEDEARELDKDDPKDKKIICYVTKMLNTSINALCGCDDDEEESGSEEGSDEDDEESDDEPPAKKNKQQDGSGFYKNNRPY